MFDLNGRTALVTGGGSGLGAAIASGFAAAGAGVAVTDISMEAARENRRGHPEGWRPGSGLANGCIQPTGDRGIGGRSAS